MPNQAPEANPRQQTPEGTPRLNSVYSDLHREWVSFANKKNAEALQQKVEELVQSQGESERERITQEAADTLRRKGEEIASRLKAVALSLQQINAEDPLAAVAQMQERGELAPNDYEIVRKIAYEINEASRAPKVTEMAYRLKTGRLNGELQEFQQESQQNPSENPPPSEELKNVTDWWMAGRELLLKSYEDKERLTKDIAQLKKDIKKAVMEERMEVVTDKKNKLDWAQNKLDALDLEGVQARLKQLQENLKARLMDEFRKDKGAYIRANFESILRQRRPGVALPTTDVQKERLIKELIAEEVKNRLKENISDTVHVFDERFQQERLQRMAEFQERTRVQKLIEAWNNLPLYKRLAVSAVIAGGVGAFVLPMLPVVGGLFSVQGGLAATFAYKGVRSAIGGSAAYAVNKAAQWLGRNAYKKEKVKLREERISGAGSAIEEETQAAEAAGINWLEDEAIKLRLAEIADHFVDEHRKASEKLHEKERNRRMWLAITTGAAAGMWAGLALDAATGGNIFGAPKRAKGWFGKWFGGEEVPPSAGKVAPPPGIAVAPEGIYPELDHPLAGPGPHSKFGVIDQVPPGARIESVEPVGKRGIWGAVEEQLKKHLEAKGGIKWTDLNEAQKTWLTDYFKDEVVGPNRGKFEVLDPDRPPAKIDFKDLFAGDAVDKALVRAQGLSPADTESILKNNADIREWVQNNPGKPLTMAQADEIIRSRIAGGARVAPDVVTARPGIEPLPDQPSGGYVGETPDTGEARAPAGPSPESDLPTVPKQPDVSPQPAPGEDQGGGRVLPVGEGATATGGAGGTTGAQSMPVGPSPSEASRAAETVFGSQVEQTVAERAGFRPEEYNLLKNVTVDKLLKEIPEGKWSTERAQMWRNFSAGSSWPKLPHTESFLQGISGYRSSELLSQADLADAIRKLPEEAAYRHLTVAEFIKQFGNQLDIQKSNPLGF